MLDVTRTAGLAAGLALLLWAPLGCPSTTDDDNGDDDNDAADDDTTDEPPEFETACDDGIDEDEDGDADCEDADCAYVIAEPGACVNEADLDIYVDLDGNAEWNACVPGPPYGEGCGTDVECNTACIHANTGISEDCARCFSEMVQCFLVLCGATCAQYGQGSPECVQCVADTCGPPYFTCFGELVCHREYGCADTVDNDGDELIDGDDPDCQ
jgi:hypothetical protein